MKASNHFILTRSLSAAGQIGCGLFGQSRLSLENCFRIFTKDYTKEIENLSLSFNFSLHLVSFIFGFTRLAVMCLV